VRPPSAFAPVASLPRGSQAPLATSCPPAQPQRPAPAAPQAQAPQRAQPAAVERRPAADPAAQHVPGSGQAAPPAQGRNARRR